MRLLRRDRPESLHMQRIDHLLPFREQKVQAKFVATHGTGRFLQSLADNLTAGNRRRSNAPGYR
jgi:hypothetical protein